MNCGCNVSTLLVWVCVCARVCMRVWVCFVCFGSCTYLSLPKTRGWLVATKLILLRQNCRPSLQSCAKRELSSQNQYVCTCRHTELLLQMCLFLNLYLFIYLLLAAKTIICGRKFSICGSDRSFDIRAHRCHTLGGNSTSFIRRRPSSLAQD